MKQYLDKLREVFETKEHYIQIRHNMDNGFPLITTKEIDWDLVILRTLDELNNPLTITMANGEIFLQVNKTHEDIFFDTPISLAVHSLILYLIAHRMKMKPKEIIYTVENAYIDTIHNEHVEEQLSRYYRALPEIWINPEKDEQFKISDIRLLGYISHRPFN
ncbi:hypothetical protein LCGC14_1253500 [marine sediment metagenome]|uniref:Thymidylate synthase/dCMP hydroxymethylase domain-containing protein n=1 Tax=marine sediment metagenome TaxID=412755 RepID=A0A0F9NJE1_9ZZZZ